MITLLFIFKMVKDKIFIGIPSREGKINSYLVNFLIQNKYYNYELFINQTQPVDYNRNVIVEEFLKGDSEWLFMVDDDMIPPNDLFDLVYVAEKMKIKIISPINLIRQNNRIRDNIFYWKKGKKEHENYNILKVDSCGCGCVFIHRNVFKDLEKPYFKFLLDKGGKLMTSENIYFTEQCRKNGIYCFVNTLYVTNHLKTIGLLDLVEKK